MPRKSKTETEKERKAEDKEEQKSEEKKISKKELKERAKKLIEGIEEEKVEKIKEGETKLIEAEEEEKKAGEKGNLVPLDDYLKASCYLGTKVIIPDMRKYVYKRRADGIAIINTNLIDEKLKEAAKFLSAYNPEDFIVVCKREAGWKAVKLFSELTGVRIFTKKYPAGIITNTALPNFFETDLIFICDPWLDKNALNDAFNVKKKTMAICDTNNLSKGIDVIIPSNNKSNKSLGLIFWILAREYMKARKIDKKLPGVEEFIGEKLEELPPRERKSKKRAEEEKAKDVERIESIMKSREEGE